MGMIENAARRAVGDTNRTTNLHQLFHIEGVTDPKAQIEKLTKIGEFGFFHNHRRAENDEPVVECNPGCHAVNAKKPT